MKLNRAIILAVLMLITACGTNVKKVEEVVEIKPEPLRYGFVEKDYKLVEGEVRKGQFFSDLLTDLGLSYKDAYLLSEAIDSVFDVRKFKVGNKYKAYYTDTSDVAIDSTYLKYIVYEKDTFSEALFSCEAPFECKVVEKKVERIAKYSDITINSSLWNDMLDAGASPYLSLKLSDIYAWTLDFFGLQKGDKFRVYYQEKVCEGKTVDIDTVFYSVFSRGSYDLQAIMYDQKDSGNIYWNEAGESMRKAFLKAPLHFSRISSGFSYNRRHPITRKVRPHTGVDYAAPKGTPVMTIGDGVVTSRKYEGAGGNVVRIKHNSVYSTAYLHLSGYAKGLSVGKRVKQGEVIGYVGSTGSSTGPHLDFRVWKHGTPVNPLKMDSPPAVPLKQENMPAFKLVCEKYKTQLDSLSKATN